MKKKNKIHLCFFFYTKEAWRQTANLSAYSQDHENSCPETEPAVLICFPSAPWCFHDSEKWKNNSLHHSWKKVGFATDSSLEFNSPEVSTGSLQKSMMLAKSPVIW